MLKAGEGLVRIQRELLENAGFHGSVMR